MNAHVASGLAFISVHQRSLAVTFAFQSLMVFVSFVLFVAKDSRYSFGMRRQGEHVGWGGLARRADQNASRKRFAIDQEFEPDFTRLLMDLEIKAVESFAGRELEGDLVTYLRC